MQDGLDKKHCRWSQTRSEATRVLGWVVILTLCGGVEQLFVMLKALGRRASHKGRCHRKCSKYMMNKTNTTSGMPTNSCNDCDRLYQPIVRHCVGINLARCNNFSSSSRVHSVFLMDGSSHSYHLLCERKLLASPTLWEANVLLWRDASAGRQVLTEPCTVLRTCGSSMRQCAPTDSFHISSPPP